MWKENKADNIFVVFIDFILFLLKAIKDTIDLGEGTSPKLALSLGSDEQDLLHTWSCQGRVVHT